MFFRRAIHAGMLTGCCVGLCSLCPLKLPSQTQDPVQKPKYAWDVQGMEIF
uniref:Uncharacterized protein n=1 Tax=Anguilla anguilla TaxID=7936 RepID=A0A0E9Q6N4_ANGAN